MLDIIGKKNWYFIFSIFIIIPGIVSLFLWGLNLSIDFTGGSRMILAFDKTVDQKTTQIIKDTFKQQNVEVVTVQPSGNDLILRTKPISEKQNKVVLEILKTKLGSIKQEDFETIGPTMGVETTLNALKATIIASILILLYVAWSFRQVPKPTSSWRFGVCAIIALVHDVLVLIGVFSILGHFWNVEIDSLFVTALLTVMGFSVHDTIVVFDRIRENLRKTIGVPFAQVVNDSILQTLVRSLNTSLTTILVLVTMLIFGGETLLWFIAALLIGITSGTYSSIFNAAAFLVYWQEISEKKKNQ